MAVQVRALHLLCKHAESRNPISRRTNESTTGVAKATAVAELTEIRAAIMAEAEGKDTQGLVDIFAARALKRSDCGSYKSGGDLGMFGRGAMQKPFEDATFALAVGEVSDIVNTDSGSHIIMRIA